MKVTRDLMLTVVIVFKHDDEGSLSLCAGSGKTLDHWHKLLKQYESDPTILPEVKAFSERVNQHHPSLYNQEKIVHYFQLMDVIPKEKLLDRVESHTLFLCLDRLAAIYGWDVLEERILSTFRWNVKHTFGVTEELKKLCSNTEEDERRGQIVTKVIDMLLHHKDKTLYDFESIMTILFNHHRWDDLDRVVTFFTSPLESDNELSRESKCLRAIHTAIPNCFENPSLFSLHQRVCAALKKRCEAEPIGPINWSIGFPGNSQHCPECKLAATFCEDKVAKKWTALFPRTKRTHVRAQLCPKNSQTPISCKEVGDQEITFTKVTSPAQSREKMKAKPRASATNATIQKPREVTDLTEDEPTVKRRKT
ncbi:hypothetical protein PROFUN_07142 [Planoprotostelium fungivorum]|uniref:Uncharacterized protein n=1 Tax=Planoprotostelium fungivorum TaxID=1890364 RepID=A0A2P6NMK5_9EUKA|nr:hypothetical protein PROFUN_07142 [Planoprotostelium fungivorum]